LGQGYSFKSYKGPRTGLGPDWGTDSTPSWGNVLFHKPNPTDDLEKEGGGGEELEGGGERKNRKLKDAWSFVKKVLNIMKGKWGSEKTKTMLNLRFSRTSNKKKNSQTGKMQNCSKEPGKKASVNPRKRVPKATTTKIERESPKGECANKGSKGPGRGSGEGTKGTNWGLLPKEKRVLKRMLGKNQVLGGADLDWFVGNEGIHVSQVDGIWQDFSWKAINNNIGTLTWR